MILYCSFSNKMSVDDQNHWICVGLSRLLHSVLGKFSHDGMNFVKQTQRLEFTFWINKVWHTKTAQLSIESGCRALLTLIFTQLLCFTDIFGYYTWALPLYPTWCLYHLTFQTDTLHLLLTYINFTNLCTSLNWGFTGKMWWTGKMKHGYRWISCSSTSCNIKIVRAWILISTLKLLEPNQYISWQILAYHRYTGIGGYVVWYASI